MTDPRVALPRGAEPETDCDCEGLWNDSTIRMGPEQREVYNRTGHLPNCPNLVPPRGEAETPTDLTIYVDQKPFSVLEQYRKHGFTELPSIPTLSGAQILALVGRDACSQLFLENPDPHKADMLIPLWNAVVLADGMQFYGLPPTIFASTPVKEVPRSLVAAAMHVVEEYDRNLPVFAKHEWLAILCLGEYRNAIDDMRREISVYNRKSNAD